MKPAVLAMLFLFASPDGWRSPEAAVGLAMFQGEWGLASVNADDTFWGEAVAGSFAEDGKGACGTEGALNLDIREEALEDGTRFLMLRKHPDAEWGAVILTLDVTNDDRATLTAKLLDDTEVYERNGDALTLVSPYARLSFERCE